MQSFIFHAAILAHYTFSKKYLNQVEEALYTSACLNLNCGAANQQPKRSKDGGIYQSL